MTLAQIYKNVHTILSKDGNEGLISMDRWNPLIYSLYHQFIKNKIEEQFYILSSGAIRPKTIYSSKLINNLIIQDTTSSTLVDAQKRKHNLSFTMLYWLSAKTATAYNGQIREIELIDEYELRNRQSSMRKPIDEYPVATILREINGLETATPHSYIYVWPTDISSIHLSYVKRPVTPFLDYYIDANYQTQFISAGTTQAITSGSQYRDGTTTGTKTSATVELELDENFHPAFQEYIVGELQRMLGDMNSEQITLAKRQMEESK
jgi:hypothetical protein